MNSVARPELNPGPVIPFRVDGVQTFDDGETTKITTGDTSFALNNTGRLIWSLCNGNFIIDEIIKMVEETFTESATESAEQTRKLIYDLTELNLLYLKSVSEHISEYPWEKEKPYVLYHRPPPEMLWHLEQVRQFISGLYEPFAFESSDIGNITLDEEDLIVAKLHDADTARSIGQGELKHYRSFTRSTTFKSHIEIIQGEIPALINGIEPIIKPSGHAYYQKGGSMGWHSNYKVPGRRIYCTWTEKEKSNFFRYEDPVTGDLVTHWEPPGWTIKSFMIPPSPYRLWHCIQADSRRFALGFRAIKEK